MNNEPVRIINDLTSLNKLRVKKFIEKHNQPVVKIPAPIINKQEAKDTEYIFIKPPTPPRPPQDDCDDEDCLI
jgi:hypothetical protein